MDKEKILSICELIENEANISIGIAMGVHNMEDADMSLIQITSNLQCVLDYVAQIKGELK